jgi:hypothetical protein
MAETLCAFPDRDETIVTYIYDELTGPARATFDAHLAICGRCRAEVAELADVRTQLDRWEPPSVGAFRPGVPAPAAWRQRVPVWVQAAAAVLLLGISAGVANLDLRYDAQGLSVRTGWSRGAAAPAAASGAATAPWRADLAALEQQLRGELHDAGAARMEAATAAAVPPSAAARAMSDADLLRRVRALLDESDKRQQRELALRLAEVMNNVTAQRNADLLKIDRSLGMIRTNTAAELMKQRGTINYLVSTTQR